MRMGLPARVGSWVAFVVVAVVVASPAVADLDAYMTVTGATQGTFVGSADVAPHEGRTVVHEFHHLIERSAGAVVHQTFIVTVELTDKALPELMRALETDETLQVTIRALEPSGTGAEFEYAQITLVDAKVASIEPLSPNNLDPNLQQFPATARIRFSYLQINFTDNEDSDTASLSNSGG